MATSGDPFHWPQHRATYNKTELATCLEEIIEFVQKYKSPDDTRTPEEILAEIGIMTIIFDVAAGRSKSFPPNSLMLDPEWYMVK